MPPFVSSENAVRVPLRIDTDVVIVPDSLAGHFPPIPEAASIEAPSAALVLAPAEPPADADYCRWTASEYIMCALAVVFVTCVVGIVIAAVHVISAVAAAVAAVYTFVASIGGMIVAAGALALVWRLAAKLSAPSAPGPIAATVTAVAHPVATVTKLAKGEPMVTQPKSEPKSGPLAHDPLAAAWVARMRDRRTNQSTGSYREDSDTHCAVGWLMHEHTPDWKATHFGRVRDAVYAKYRKLNLSKIERMNDSGTPLTKIADHVERELGK